MATSIIWQGNLRAGLAAFETKIHARLEAITHYAAADMEAMAKSNAPWRDQTSNARNGLRGIPVIVPGKSYEAVLAHSVPYGIWLEVRWAGKYAIIMPTIRAESVKMAAMLRGVIGGL